MITELFWDNDNTSKKVILVGDGCVGKTTFVRRLSKKEVELTYIPTIGVDVTHININYKLYNIWDCAGQDKFGGLRDGYYIGAEMILVMVNPKKQGWRKSCKNWITDTQRVCENASIYIIYDSFDIEEDDKEAIPELSNGKFDYKGNKIKIFDINSDLELPFLEL